MAYEDEKPTGILTIVLWLVGLILVSLLSIVHWMG